MTDHARGSHRSPQFSNHNGRTERVRPVIASIWWTLGTEKRSRRRSTNVGIVAARDDLAGHSRGRFQGLGRRMVALAVRAHLGTAAPFFWSRTDLGPVRSTVIRSTGSGLRAGRGALSRPSRIHAIGTVGASLADAPNTGITGGASTTRSAGWWIGPKASLTTAGHTAAGITFPATNAPRRYSRAHDLPTRRAFLDQAPATGRLCGTTFRGSHSAASAFLCHVGILYSWFLPRGFAGHAAPPLGLRLYGVTLPRAARRAPPDSSGRRGNAGSK